MNIKEKLKVEKDLEHTRGYYLALGLKQGRKEVQDEIIEALGLYDRFEIVKEDY